ncbi:MAG: DUF2442 domain-containing protein [Acidobacteria bacterium]|nr:DUF2442 domain-containing protein [Acidobacteriota bacterium]
MSSLVVEMQEARARSASVTHDALMVELVDGRTIVVPLLWYPRLWHGTPQERSRFEVFGDGTYIHWPDLDEDLTVAGLLTGRRSGESPGSLRKWLESRKGKPTETDQGRSNKRMEPTRQRRSAAERRMVRPSGTAGARSRMADV